MGRHHGRGSGFRVAPLGVCAAFAMATLLAACTGLVEPDVFEKVRSIDLLPRFPDQVEQDKAVTGRRVRGAVFAGDDAPDGARAGDSAASGGGSGGAGGGYDLAFENTPVASVAKVVLGDILGVGYTIDSRVQGTVSLSSGRPVPKSDIVFVLENALRLVGVALVRDPDGYRLMPVADALGAGGADAADRTEPGYGISVVPLRYVSAPTVLKLIDSFATKPGMARADAARNLLIIQGTGSERRNAVDLVIGFDADWMRGQSVGIFPVQNSAPDPIIAELEKILDTGEGGTSQSVVKFMAVGRMNAILAVTRKTDVLRRVETWVRRLDQADTGRSGVRVYRIKYGEARHLARILNDIFAGPGGAGGSSLDAAAGQLAPGSGLAAGSSGSALNRLSAAGTGGPGGFGGGTGGGMLGSGRGGSGTGTGGGFGGSGTGLGGAGAGAAGTAAGGLGGTGASATANAGNMFDVRGGSLFGPGPGGGASAGSNQAVLPGTRITADTVNNSLLIYASQEHYAIIEQTIRQLDRPQLQVGIEATIAEVTLNDNLTYGVQAFLTSQNLGLPIDRGSALNTTATQPPAAAAAGAAGQVANAFINRALPGFNFLIGREASPTAILNALNTITSVKVLSNPSVVVIDNQIATLQVGDEVPVSTGSATVLTTNNTVVNTIDYRNTGIILRVVPRINANGNVRLDVEQEISNVTPGSAGSLTPTVAQRRVRSSVAVASGQTVLLAGLISERQSGNKQGIPLLHEIPGLGIAFSSTGRGVTRTELIVFIRPQIIRDSVDAHYVAEELRTKLRGTLGAAGPPPSILVAPIP